MARHRTRVCAAYMCALSIDRSPTTDSENFEIKSGDGAARERCIHRVYACTWYVCMSYWLKGWYTLGTWYSTISPIGYCIKFVPGILHCYSSKVELPQHTLLRTNFWHEIVGASRVWTMHTRWAERGRQETSNLLSRLRLWRLPYKTSYQVGVLAKQYYTEIWTKKRGTQYRGLRKLQNATIWWLSWRRTFIWFSSLG